jgi:hypothetical protein
MTGRAATRRSRRSRRSATRAYEVPLGASDPRLLRAAGLALHARARATEADFAELAVLMRRHAVAHPGAQFRTPITVDEVLASKPIAVAAEGAGLLPGVRRRLRRRREPRARGAAPHAHQRHGAGAQRAARVAAMEPDDFGAGSLAPQRALAAAGRTLADVDYAAIYDSFTDHARDPARGDRPGAARPRRRAGARRALLAHGAMPLNTARRTAQLRPLRRGAVRWRTWPRRTCR